MPGVARVRWGAGVVAVGLVVSACTPGGGSGGTGAAGSSQVVRASWGDPQNPLEPANTNEVQGGKVLGMIFRGLKHYDPVSGKAENMVADSITSSDQRSFTVKLKHGWTFSDGSPVTARSFVDAWNYGALVTNNQVNAHFFAYIEGYDQVHPAAENARPTARTMSGLEVVDEHTFTIRLTQAFSSFPDTLGYTAFYPLPRSFYRDHAAWLAKPVGNGPYQVASYTRGQVMELRRSPSYSGPDKARNEGVDLKVYTDNNTAYTDLQAGNLDIADDIPAAQLPNVKSDLGNRYINQPAGILQTLAFPMYRQAWGSDRARSLRRGLSMAIDRERITSTIYRDTRMPAKDWTSPVLGKDGGYRTDVCGEACTYDPQQAKRLIDEAGGLPGGRVTLTSNVDSGSHREWMDAVCNSINRALDNDRACTVEPVGTFADYRKRVTNRQMNGMFRSGWQMDYPLIQNFLEPLYYTGASSNESGYHNPEFDDRVDRANAAGSRSDTVQEFVSAERLVARDLPTIPLWYQNGTAGHSERVSNVRLDPFSVPVFTDVKVTS
ncbi:peptide ABC transporter substrate-binding protein [Wenjunlia vitaminophila]|uniref:Peptide ABC transporter substrate-binding protein n=1 Tax=Wenjunlia vitaminophila TaxID=76728 RepID=A0A0T6LLT6_WENVI|nr:ABC transporter substrate-binding protein [Wenjunlia vitaminophila]KRV47053.1 peptide ABC transporter substrate-binding protein [Wenjunlia vitaminophila]